MRHYYTELSQAIKCDGKLEYRFDVSKITFASCNRDICGDKYWTIRYPCLRERLTNFILVPNKNINIKAILFEARSQIKISQLMVLVTFISELISREHSNLEIGTELLLCTKLRAKSDVSLEVSKTTALQLSIGDLNF